MKTPRKKYSTTFYAQAPLWAIYLYGSKIPDQPLTSPWEELANMQADVLRPLASLPRFPRRPRQRERKTLRRQRRRSVRMPNRHHGSVRKFRSTRESVNSDHHASYNTSVGTTIELVPAEDHYPRLMMDLTSEKIYIDLSLIHI